MIKNFRVIQFNLILNVFYLKLFITKNIVELSNIDNKKHYITYIKRIKQLNKSKRLIRENTILFLN